jgi:hypothetical protein
MGDELIRGLCDPGTKCVFIDETETSGKPLPNLARDFQMVCGVELDSADYAKVRQAMEEQLLRLSGVEEFHATEIVNGGHDSRWRTIPIADRQRVLESLTQLASQHVQRIYLAFVTGDDYVRLLRETLVSSREAGSGTPDLPPTLSQGRALEKAFLNRLILWVSRVHANTRVAFVCDSKKALKDSVKTNPIRADVLENVNAYQNVIIQADSRTVPGLQLADFVAFTLNRLPRIRHKLDFEEIGGFDGVILDAASALAPRIINVLSDPP